MISTRVLEIDVDQVEPDPENVRTTYDATIVAGLASFLKNEGKFIEDPVVWQVGVLPDGRPQYRAYSGSTRVLAAQGVGGKLTVVVLPEPPQRPVKVLGQLSTGLLKGDLNPMDIARALGEVRDGERPTLSLSQIAARLKDYGISRSREWISSYLKLLDLEPQVQEMIARNQLPVDVASVLVQERGAGQVRLAERIKAGWDWRGDRRAAIGPSLSPSVDAEMRERLSQEAAAREADGRKSAGRRGPDANRRHGPVTRRYALSGIANPQVFSYPAGQLAAGREAAIAAIPEEWAAAASEDEKSLAREVHLLGGRDASEAIRWVEAATREAEDAPDDLLTAVHCLRRLLESHGADPGDTRRHPALFELLRLRAATLVRATDPSARG